MNNLRKEKHKRIENSIIKDVRNLFRLKTEIVDTAVKNISFLNKKSYQRQNN